MNRNVKRFLVALSIVTLLVIGTAAAAFAAGPQDPTVCPQDCTGPRGAGWGQGGIIYNEDVTNLLGLTTEEIQAQRQEGKSLAHIAADKGVSEDDLVNAILSDRKAALQDRVEDGILTQEQADQRLEIMKENVQDAISRTTLGPPENRGFFGNGQQGLRSGQCRFNNGEPGTGSGPGMMQRFGRGNF